MAIKIKKAHKGRLTAKIGKPTVKKLKKAKKSSSPALRKQATFALNARKWKHKSSQRKRK